MKSNKFIFPLAALFGLLIWIFRKPFEKTAKTILNNKEMNNPFNIRNNKKNKWQGLVNSLSAFCQFTSIQFGIRAAIKIYRTKLKRGLTTVEKFVTDYAPPSENDTANYIDFVSQQTGFHPSLYKLTDQDCFAVLKAIARMESNYSLDINIYNEALKLA